MTIPDNRDRAKEVCAELYYDVEGITNNPDTEPMIHNDNITVIEKAIDQAEQLGWQKALEGEKSHFNDLLNASRTILAESRDGYFKDILKSAIAKSERSALADGGK